MKTLKSAVVAGDKRDVSCSCQGRQNLRIPLVRLAVPYVHSPKTSGFLQCMSQLEEGLSWNAFSAVLYAM